MTNEQVRAFLMEHAEADYQEFSAGLIPGVAKMFGVRIPVLRGLAREIAKEDYRTYLENAADDSFEEVMLQGLVIGYIHADIEEVLSYAATFIPKIRDWSINDGFCSTFKIARKHRERAWEFLMPYCKVQEEFPQRVVAVMLMNHFLVEEYIDRVLEVWDSLDYDGYYRKMGVAWGIATAYAKFPEQTHAFLLNNHLDDETYNKAIRKMIESYRISRNRRIFCAG